MIKLTNLDKFFNKGKRNEIHVINNASIELPDKGIVTFFGHSGSGKTTLLNAIGGLDSFKGQIQYDDTTISNYKMGEMDKFRSKNIGYVFQNYDLLQNESVYDNLAIALSIIGINDKNEVKSRIEYALKAVGLFKYRKKKAFALSGGQQQRVAIARALVKKCKILIADEPTGNLDSANTLEVMNVLKSISKNTLVLLVTHEKNIADFYSDLIVEMADGQIVSVSENEAQERSIQEEHSNAVYLGDMDRVEQDGDAVSLTIYRDPGDEEKRHIEVFIKNNTIYIRGDSRMRLANETSLNIIDGKRKTISSKDEDSLTYDNSFYDDTKKGHRGVGYLFKQFGHAFKALFARKKRTVFLYISLAFMGIVFAVASAAYVNNTMTDDSSFAYAQGFYSCLNSDWHMGEKYIDAYDKGYISNIELSYGGNYSFREDVTFTEYIETRFSAMKVPYKDGKVDLKYGRGVKTDSEMVISENLAKTILSSFTYKATPKDLINKTVSDMWGNEESFTIVGISQNDNNIAYVTEKSIILNNTYYDPSRAVLLSSAAENGHYTVVAGRDVDNSSSNKECLVLNSMVLDSNYYAGPKYDICEFSATELKYDGTETFGDYTIVGAFELKHEIACADALIMTNGSISECSSPITSDYIDETVAFSEYYTYLVQGKAPVLSKEIAVNIYSGYSIGSKIGDYTVVGLVSGGSFVFDRKVFFNKNVANIHQGADYCLLETNDAAATKEYFASEYDIEFGDMYTIQYKTKLQNEAKTKAIFYSVFIISFLVAGIFIFFIMRSRMLADIYEIGVYRSLGAKRWSIVSKYMLESAILTFLFTITGYIVGCLVYNGISGLINGIFGTAVAMTNVPAFIIIGLIIFVGSTLVGTLPIVALFTKTPAQIKSKYDI